MDAIKGSDLVGLGAAMEQLRMEVEAACGKRLQPGDKVEVLGYVRWISAELVKIVPATAGYVTTYEVRTDDGETWVVIAEAIRACVARATTDEDDPPTYEVSIDPKDMRRWNPNVILDEREG